jgi:hypothetical protein
MGLDVPSDGNLEDGGGDHTMAASLAFLLPPMFLALRQPWSPMGFDDIDTLWSLTMRGFRIRSRALVVFCTLLSMSKMDLIVSSAVCISARA